MAGEEKKQSKTVTFDPGKITEFKKNDHIPKKSILKNTQRIFSSPHFLDQYNHLVTEAISNNDIDAKKGLATFLSTLSEKNISLCLKKFRSQYQAKKSFPGYSDVKNILQHFSDLPKSVSNLDKDFQLYQHESKLEIEDIIKNNYPDIYKLYCKNQSALVDGQRLILTHNIDWLVSFCGRLIKNKDINDPHLDLPIQQYNAVKEIRRTLNSTYINHAVQIAEAKKTYDTHRSIIEKSNDSKRKTLAKVIATFFTISLAWLFGLWETRGEKLSSKVKRR